MILSCWDKDSPAPGPARAVAKRRLLGGLMNIRWKDIWKQYEKMMEYVMNMCEALGTTKRIWWNIKWNMVESCTIHDYTNTNTNYTMTWTVKNHGKSHRGASIEEVWLQHIPAHVPLRGALREMSTSKWTAVPALTIEIYWNISRTIEINLIYIIIYNNCGHIFQIISTSP